MRYVLICLRNAFLHSLDLSIIALRNSIRSISCRFEQGSSQLKTQLLMAGRGNGPWERPSWYVTLPSCASYLKKNMLYWNLCWTIWIRLRGRRSYWRERSSRTSSGDLWKASTGNSSTPFMKPSAVAQLRCRRPHSPPHKPRP